MKSLLILGLWLLADGTAERKPDPKPMSVLIEENMKLAASQYKLLAKNTPSERMPQYYEAGKDKMVTSTTTWWCSGFFPGSLWYIYEYTKDEAIKQEAEKRLAILEKEKHFKGNHDLGFMMYCSFGNAYRITGNQSYKTTIDTSAISLSTRYKPAIQSIQSWDSGKTFKCPVIIDNMMNLELLCWVSSQGGSKEFHNIAVTHANTTIERQYRPDYSSWHVLDYVLSTGKIAGRKTWQGYSDESTWSRGQAWGLYGFSTMYRFTKDKRYLQQAQKIAQFLLTHKNMPEDLIPYWDFDSPEIPNALRDASAAAILASALLELSRYSKKKESKIYVAASEKIIRVLSSDTYRAKPGENGGFLLMHSVGAFPLNSEVDVPLTYADYYFLEAQQRYKTWVINK